MSLHAAAVGPSVLPDLREQVEQIIAEARRQGASACEVAVSLEQGLSTSVRQGEVETVEFNRDQGFGITLYAGQRKGSASTSARRAISPVGKVWPPGRCSRKPTTSCSIPVAIRYCPGTGAASASTTPTGPSANFSD